METIHIPPVSQKKLLYLSRQALEHFVFGREIKSEETDDPYLLNSDYGGFVSLHKGQELRGCIGTCFPTAPLYKTIIEMTEAAASRDPRVSPISPSEVGEIHIGISILSPLRAVEDPMSLEIGKHGVYVASKGKRAVLLPQVATEYCWDREVFLSQVCLKAGLPEAAWKWPQTKISSFTALVVEEER